MKYADDPHFPQWLSVHPEIADQLAEHKYINRALEYLLEVGYHKYEDLLSSFEQSSSKLKQTMLTTRQQIERIGKREGMQIERMQIARNMLRS